MRQVERVAAKAQNETPKPVPNKHACDQCDHRCTKKTNGRKEEACAFNIFIRIHGNIIVC